jgi:hypothetical protein
MLVPERKGPNAISIRLLQDDDGNELIEYVDDDHEEVGEP